MVTAPSISSGPGLVAARGGSVRLLLRLEGLVVAAFSAIFYAHTGVSWWLFAALWLAPDLSMLGYLSSPCRGARIYNAIHTYMVPAVLGLSAYLLHERVALAVALIWANHIGVDRLLGSGLKYADGFGWTHLSVMERRRKAIPPMGVQ